jgi:uncharacterized protein YciI
VPAQLALLTYSYVEDMAAKREPYRDGHLALISRFAGEGRLFMAGATGNPPVGGSLVFADEAAAEEFFNADPYAAAGLITAHSIVPYAVVASAAVDVG